MENLGVSDVTTYRLKNGFAFKMVRAVFGNYVFNRKSKDGKYYVRLSAKQEAHVKSMGITLISVEDED